jgi:hypothetical protein
LIIVLVGTLLFLSWLGRKSKAVPNKTINIVSVVLSALAGVLLLAHFCAQPADKKKRITVKRHPPITCKKNLCIEPPGLETIDRLVLYHNGMIPRTLFKACPHAPVVIVKSDTEVECHYGTKGIPPYFFKVK